MGTTARILIITLLVFLVSTVVVYFGLGYVFPKRSTPKPVFLKVEGFWDPAIFSVVKKEFQEKNPSITLEYEQKDPERYFPNLKNDLNTKTGPDVFWWQSSWGPLLQRELAAVPDEVFTKEEFEKTFYPITKTDLLINNQYRGVPLDFDGLALLVNKKILASANLPERPETWNILSQEYVGPLTKHSGKRLVNSAIALGSVTNVENFPEIVGLFLLQNGATFTKNGQLVLGSKVNATTGGGNLTAEAIDFFFRFSKVDRTWDNTLPNDIEAFARGQTAMIILPSYKIHKLLAKVREANLTLDFAVEPLPQLPDSETVTWGRYWSLGVSNASPQKKAAWKLVKFLTSTESLRTVYKLEAQNNDFGRIYPRIDMAKEQTTNPYLTAYLAQAQTAKSWYLQSDTFDKSLNDKIIAGFASILGIIETNDSAAQYLEQLVEKINPTLKVYGVVTQDPPKAD